MSQKSAEAVTLTNDETAGSFPVDSQTIGSQLPVLEMTVSSISNPSTTPFSISVYLSRSETEEPAESERIPVGSFSIYPPDRPGKFLLRSSAALRQLNERLGDAKSDEVQLVIELKRVDETKPWTSIEVTVEPPKWLQDEKQ